MIAFLDFTWLRADWWPVALAVPALALVGGLVARRRRRARVRLADAALLGGVAGEWSERRAALRAALELGAVALAVVALLGPVRGFTERPAIRRGLDLAVCVDTSRSMLARDLNPDRLSRARREVRGLFDQLAGDRVALLAFAGDAREVAPLTRDTRTLSALLDELDPDQNRVGGTDLGVALERALDLFDGRTGAHEAIVVLTDGEDLTGAGQAVAARAAEAGIRIYVVGIGTDGGAKIPVTSTDGREGFLRGPDGDEVVTRLDRASLAAIAETTGGAFLTTSDSATPLEELYAKRIGRLDRRELEGGMERIPHDRFQWALVPAVALWLLAAAVGERRRLRRPARGRGGGGGTATASGAGRAVGAAGRAAAVAVLVGLAAGLARGQASGDAEPARHPLVAALEDAVAAAEQGDHLAAMLLLDAALGDEDPAPEGATRDGVGGPVQGATGDATSGTVQGEGDPTEDGPAGSSGDAGAHADTSGDDAAVPGSTGGGTPDSADDDPAPTRTARERAYLSTGGGIPDSADDDPAPTWTARERAYLRHARGVVHGLLDFRTLAEADLEAAAAGFGPGPERRAALAQRFALRLERAEQRRAEVLAPQQPAPGAPPADGDGEEDEDPLAELRRLYLAAREAGLERLDADWTDVDVRANLELCTRRLRELDELERQRDEQEQEQQEQRDQDRQDQDQQDQDQDQQGEQEQGDPQDPRRRDEQDPQEREAPEEQPEPEPGPQGEDDEEPEPRPQPEPEELPASGELSKEELQRLMQRLTELEAAQEELERRIQGARRQPVDRDW